jgi:hypothetical protein
MNSRRLAIVLAAALCLVTAVALAAPAFASAPPKPVTSNAVPVSGAVVTKVTVRAAVKNNRLTVTLVPGHYPFAKKSVSLKGRVSDWSASAIKVRIKATGPRRDWHRHRDRPAQRRPARRRRLRDRLDGRDEQQRHPAADARGSLIAYARSNLR